MIKMIFTQTRKLKHSFNPEDFKNLGRGSFYIGQIFFCHPEKASLGDEVGFNYNCYVNAYGGLSIGNRCRFGPGVMIHTANHRFDDLRQPIISQGWVAKPVTIGEDCWVGMGAIILPGVAVGNHAVIGAGAVVTRNVAPFTVVAGNPARRIRQLKTIL